MIQVLSRISSVPGWQSLGPKPKLAPCCIKRLEPTMGIAQTPRRSLSLRPARSSPMAIVCDVPSVICAVVMATSTPATPRPQYTAEPVLGSIAVFAQIAGLSTTKPSPAL